MEKINQRRRQIHVHSILYYHFDTNIVPDHQYDAWCVELAELQKAYPQCRYEGYLPECFKDWTGETGFHLPVREEMLEVAMWLIKNRR